MTNVFVGNLTWSTTQEDLQAVFARFQGVSAIDIPTNESNGQPKGFALVQMAKDTAEMAIAQLHGTKLNGRLINVRHALPVVILE